MPETHTLQGELIIGNIVHGAALNCMVVLYNDPDNWEFKQFATNEQMETFAMEHQLVMKRKEDESNNRT
jgi:hypothetical protein